MKAKRSSRPPPGWTIVVQFYAYAPDDFEKRTGITCAGDGDMFTTREQAIDAAWTEIEVDEARRLKAEQADKPKRKRGAQRAAAKGGA